MNRTRVEYDNLNSRQQENYNTAKFAAAMADYGYAVLRLSDDWRGADVICVHVDGKQDLRVQIKSRLTVHEKYKGKGLWIAFREREEQGDVWFLYEHDTMLERAQQHVGHTVSLGQRGAYSWPGVPVWARDVLKDCML